MSEPVNPITVVAAFDFDGTITRRDCVVPFLVRSAGRVRLVIGLGVRLHRVVGALARRDRNLLRAVATESVFRGRDLATIDRVAATFAGEIVADNLRPDVVARLRWHIDAGHHVVIVSASYEVYVRAVAAHLGAHGVVATRLEVGDGDRLTGRLAGANCRAAEKVARLDEWLTRREVKRADVTLWAYGDSAGDRELLAAAQHPIWVTEPLASVSPSP